MSESWTNFQNICNEDYSGRLHIQQANGANVFFAIWFEPTLPAVWLNLHAEKKSFRIVLSKTNVKRRNQVRFPKPSDPDVLPNISLDP